MSGNDFIAGVLRSPFHGLLSNGMMLITVTGCKTGRKYTTPVEYYLEGGFLWVMTSRDRTWWRNLKGSAQVELLLRRTPVTGIADIELDEKVVQTRLVEYLRHVPQAAKPMGIRMENRKPNHEDVARAANDRLFVKIRI
jgi:hypothetical protein